MAFREAISPLYQDPFMPVLFSSEVLAVSLEQKIYIKKILDKACSDSKFAEKAYVAILLVLEGGSVTVPEITSLTPNSAEVGDPSFLLHVHGKGFTSLSKIVFNGGEEPTTFVSATELTTTVNMSTVGAPVTVPVAVLSEDGVLSAFSNFTFTDGTPALAAVGTGKKESAPVAKVVDVPKSTTPPAQKQSEK